MRIKTLVLIALVVVAVQAATLHRQKRTLGVLSAGANLVAGTASTALGAGAAALKIGGAILIGKTLILLIGGKYLILRHLLDQSQNEGINFGQTSGVGVGPWTFGTTQGVGFGGRPGGIPQPGPVGHNPSGPLYPDPHPWKIVGVVKEGEWQTVSVGDSSW